MAHAYPTQPTILPTYLVYPNQGTALVASFQQPYAPMPNQPNLAINFAPSEAAISRAEFEVILQNLNDNTLDVVQTCIITRV